LSRKNQTIRFPKTDYLVSADLKPLDRPHLFTIFSLLSLSHTRTTVRVTLRPPLVIPWFLRGILEFLGEINSPRIGVSVSPTGFSHLKVSSPNPRSLCPMDGFEIPLVHCLHHIINQSTAISLSFLG
jgi:hypothetical protein